MKLVRLNNICKNILNAIIQKKRIDETQIHVFMEGIVDWFEEPVKEEHPSDLEKLKVRINELWQYKEFDGISVEQAFLLGSVWSGITLTDLQCRRTGKRKALDTLVLQYDNQYWFFRAIHDNPGIRHKELAQKGDWSPSKLSQFVSALDKNELISFNRIGREKYYFLKKDGEQLYEQIKQKRKAKHLKYSIPNKAIYQDNSEIEENESGLLLKEMIQKDIFFNLVKSINLRKAELYNFNEDNVFSYSIDKRGGSEKKCYAKVVEKNFINSY